MSEEQHSDSEHMYSGAVQDAPKVVEHQYL
jgi:hypothetical protein